MYGKFYAKQVSLFFLLISFSFLYADKLHLTTNHWYPYVSFDEHSQGVMVEIVSMTLKHMNQKFVIEENEFERGYERTISNEYDATFPYYFTSERAEQVYFSDALLGVENVLFYNKDNYVQNIKNIYSYKLGVVKGYAYKNIEVKKFTNKIVIDNEIEAFDMLNSGSIDLLPANKLVGIHIIKKYFNDFYSNVDFIKDKNFTSTDFLYFIASKNKKNKQLIARFNKSLAELKRQGKYKKILLQNRDVLNANLSNVVRLTNNTETFPMVVASRNLKTKKKYIIPRGTKAIVIRWSKHFKEDGNLKIYDEMFKKTQVKIINGPLKGQILFVENMYIEIE